MADHPNARESWAQREAARRERDEKEAARQAEKVNIWGAQQRHWADRVERMFNGSKLTDDELKERDRIRTEASAAAVATQREREAWRRQLGDRLSAAERAVDAWIAKARNPLSDDELDEFVAAHQRAVSLKVLANRVAAADQQAASAASLRFTATPTMARV